MRNKNIFVQLLLCSLLCFPGGFYEQGVQAQQQINPDRQIRPQSPIRRTVVPIEMLELQLDTIPNLVGMEYNEDIIRTLLDVHGLELGNAVTVGDNQNIGIITGQSPLSGDIITSNPRIDITYGINIPTGISNQPENVIVPNYIGMTENKAFSRMQNDRLSRGNRREVNSDMQFGIVVAQFPEAGMEVDPGTEIHLDISIVPPQEIRVIVPQLVGFSLQYAAEVLREAGLLVGDLKEQISNEPEGTILRQSPLPETEVVRGSVVHIIYSVRAVEELIRVPDVRELHRDEAIRIIKENRLNYSIGYVNETGYRAGVVVEQNPRPETMVAPGSDVTILVQNNTLSPWVYWGGGVLVVGLLAGFVVRKMSSGRKKKQIAKKDILIDLKPIYDTGRQIIISEENKLSYTKVHLKCILDFGVQTLKTD